MVKKLVVAAALFCLLGYGCYVFFRPARPNIIFLLIDTVRADHLSLFGYERDTSPNIAAFADENLSFSFAVAPAPWTPSSMASILTGLYPSAHRMSPPNDRDLARKVSSRLSNDFETLPETLRKAGYQTAAIITNPWMKPEFGVARGFDSYTYFERAPAETVNATAFKLIKSLKEKSRPFFLFLHYMDAHNPYRPPPEYAARYPQPLKSHDYPPRQAKYMQLYDGAIRYLDANLGDLFSYLKQEGLYHKAQIILAADHGEQFKEHGNQGHGYRLFNEEVRVPLVLKASGKSARIDHPVSLVDIYPTVFEMAGLKPKMPHQGFSLLSALDTRQKTGVLSEVHRNFSSKAYISPEGRKLILDFDLQLGLAIETDRPADLITITEPGKSYAEETTVTDKDTEHRLHADYKSLYQQTLELGSTFKAAEVAVPDDTLKELQSLGYVN